MTAEDVMIPLSEDVMRDDAKPMRQMTRVGVGLGRREEQQRRKKKAN